MSPSRLARRAWRHTADRLFLSCLLVCLLAAPLFASTPPQAEPAQPATTARAPRPVADTHPDGTGWLLAGLFALATGALTLKQLFRRDPPLRDEFVTRLEYDRDRQQWAERDERITALTDKLFAKSETMSGDLKAVASQVEKLDESHARLTYKIDQLLIARK